MSVHLNTISARCPVRARVGLGRAVVFGAASAAVPALNHGLSVTSGVGAAAMIAAAFALWSWFTRCGGRSGAQLLGALVVAQLLVHTILRVAHPVSDPAVAAQSAHAAHLRIASSGATSADALSASAVMLASHLVAIIIGAVVLGALERRALRVAARCVERVFLLVAQTLCAPRRRSRDQAPGTRSGWFLRRAATEAVARRSRLDSRTRPHRGPPRHAAPPCAA